MSHLHRRTALTGASAVVLATGLLPLATAQAQDQHHRANNPTPRTYC
jgi:hypothetical protein